MISAQASLLNLVLAPCRTSRPPPPQHCVWDRAAKSSLADAQFTPHAYCSDVPDGWCGWQRLQRPFGTSTMASFEFLTGWRKGVGTKVGRHTGAHALARAMGTE